MVDITHACGARWGSGAKSSLSEHKSNEIHDEAVPSRRGRLPASTPSSRSSAPSRLRSNYSVEAISQDRALPFLTLPFLPRHGPSRHFLLIRPLLFIRMIHIKWGGLQENDVTTRGYACPWASSARWRSPKRRGRGRRPGPWPRLCHIRPQHDIQTVIMKGRDIPPAPSFMIKGHAGPPHQQP